LWVLAAGTHGRLGQELTDHIPGRCHEAVALSCDELDMIDPTAVEREEVGVSIEEPRNL
jgi:dTDP-4-dehydrorhamnose reductase